MMEKPRAGKFFHAWFDPTDAHGPCPYCAIELAAGGGTDGDLRFCDVLRDHLAHCPKRPILEGAR